MNPGMTNKARLDVPRYVVKVYPGEYPSQASTQISMKENPEPVVGKPGFQTESNGFNEYSGKPGTRTTRFRLRSSRGTSNGRQGVLRLAVEARTTPIEQHQQSAGYQTTITSDYKKEMLLPLVACLGFCMIYRIYTTVPVLVYLHSCTA